MVREYCPDKKMKMYSGYYKEAKHFYLNSQPDKATYKKLRNRLRRRSESRIINEQLQAFDEYSQWQEIQ